MNSLKPTNMKPQGKNICAYIVIDIRLNSKMHCFGESCKYDFEISELYYIVTEERGAVVVYGIIDDFQSRSE